MLLAKINLIGQTTIFFEDFENKNSRKQFEANFNDNGKGNYFKITSLNQTNNLPAYINFQGNYFVAAENIDDIGLKPATIVFQPVDLNFYKDVSFSIYLAATSEKNKLDADDYIKIEYEKNNDGEFRPLCAFYGYDWINNDKTNGKMREDLNLDGLADSNGIELTSEFKSLSYSIDSSVKSIRLRILLSVNASEEEVAFDNIKITSIKKQLPSVSPEFIDNYPKIIKITDSCVILNYAFNFPFNLRYSIKALNSNEIKVNQIPVDFSYFPLIDTIKSLIPDNEYELNYYSYNLSDTTNIINIKTLYFKTLPIDTISPEILAIGFPQNKNTNVSLYPVINIETNEVIKHGDGFLKIYEKNNPKEIFKTNSENNAVKILSNNNLQKSNITIFLTTPLKPSHIYIINIDSNFVYDNNNNCLKKFKKEFYTRKQNLFFSEYIEGSSNNKALEIYNPTNKPVDLNNYFIRSATNGSIWNKNIFNFPKGKILKPGAVYTIANKQADSAIISKADTLLSSTQAGSLVGFTGNDARGLFYIENNDTILIDIIGEYDLTNPGDGWQIDSTVNATKDHTLIRKAKIFSGNDNWNISSGTFTSQSEWLLFNNNYFDNFGFHNSIDTIFDTDSSNNLIIDTTNNLIIDTTNNIKFSLSNKKDILKFEITGQNGNTIIDTIYNKIYITIDSSVNLAEIQPTIEISEYASIDPMSLPINLNLNEITIKIIAQDSSIKVWNIYIQRIKQENNEIQNNYKPIRIKEVKFMMIEKGIIEFKIKIENELPIIKDSIKFYYGFEEGMYFYQTPINNVPDSINLFTARIYYQTNVSKIFYSITSSEHIYDTNYNTKYCDSIINLNFKNQIIEFSNNTEIEIFPNPCSQYLYIKSFYPIQNIQITDLKGQIKNKIECRNDAIKIIDVSELSPDYYFLSVMTNNMKITKKILIRQQ
jgi:hypothetical protein